MLYYNEYNETYHPSFFFFNLKKKKKKKPILEFHVTYSKLGLDFLNINLIIGILSH